MNSFYCKHIRICNGKESEINVERLIKSIECQFNTDFTLIPNWKQLLENIDHKKQTFKRKIKSAAHRELCIINKIHEQHFRPSPFDLTEGLARTAKLWEKIEVSCRKRKEFPKSVIGSFSDKTDDDLPGVNDMDLTAHPNTEMFQSEDFTETVIPASVVEDEIKPSVTHFPIVICTNSHRLISPLKSLYSSIIKKTKVDHEEALPRQSWKLNCISNSQSITCKPSKIVIDNNILEKQVVKFYLTNVCTEALNIRFFTMTDTSSFKKATVYPKTPRKLYPGLSASYKFIFTLASNTINIKLLLHFRVGRNVFLGEPDEVFSVPVTEKPAELERKILVTEEINIPSVYSWQIDVQSYFPKSYLEISNCDNQNYHIYIRKREVDFSNEPDNQEQSIDLNGLTTESVRQRMEDNKLEMQSELCSDSKKEEFLETVESISNVGLINFVLDDIVKLALETFIFEKIFLDLQPYSKSKSSVFFSKAEHVGYHQCYYDLEFYDAHTDNLVITKTIKVFAEVLAHPVQIHPNILDMSESPINFGFREDRFVIKNTHKLYPVTLKIELTKKMRRLLQITPTEMTIPYSSSESIIVRVCSKNNTDKYSKDQSDMVHFTIKIILSGHESIYSKVPFMFYEIIVPCVTEFEKIYRNS